MNQSLIKKDSDIHGIGIFANKKIDEGDFFYSIPLDSIYNSPKAKCAFIGKSTWVSDSKILNNVNHSCDPSAKIDFQGEHPVLVALRDIAFGEEVTCDYNQTEIGGKKIECHCGAKKCRGFFLRIE